MLELRLLGAVIALVDGAVIDLGPARQRCVLAALAVDVDRVVSVDRLIGRVWGEDPPPRARETLLNYLSRLRHLLAGAGVADSVAVVRRSGGYALQTEPSAVDLHRFRDLTGRARARTDDNDVVARLTEALGLWRGEALAGLTGAWAEAERDRLRQERLAAEHDLVDARLRIGHGEELGTDPGPRPQDLHRRILAADPALTGTPVPTALPLGPVVPRQLPAAPASFVGRGAELDRLDAALLTAPAATVVISAVTGAGGIGKTWLAVHWAHRHLDRFPDGQLYVDLHGFDPAGEPMAPATAVRGFLNGLGVHPAAVPPDPHAQTGLYRSLAAGKRMLVLLDNAFDSAQVAPLLPGSATCTVLVTSRRRLAKLITAHGARAVDLDVLTDAEARDVLTRHIGADPLAAEPQAVAELLQWCDGLPLALGVVCARATTHPDFPLAVLADELRDASTRLRLLDEGESGAGLSAVFSWSYRALSPDAASLFRLLAIAPGPDTSVPAAASLAGAQVPRVNELLRELETAHLVAQPVPGRYRMHDLIRLYATERAHADTSARDREAALRRVVDFHLHTAYHGELVLYPYRHPLHLKPVAHGCEPRVLDDEAAVLGWFDAEHPALLAAQSLAAQRGWHESVRALAWSLNAFHARRGYVRDELAVWQAALTSAECTGESVALAEAHRYLAHAYVRSGQYGDGLVHMYQALTLTGDVPEHVGTAADDQQQMFDVANAALDFYRNLNDPLGEADALAAVGWLFAQFGHYDKARSHCERALALFRTHHDRVGEGHTLDNLGYTAHHVGRHADAVTYYQQSRTLCRDVGDRYGEAMALCHLGELHTATGRHSEAVEFLQQALALSRDLGHAEREADTLGTLRRARRHP